MISRLIGNGRTSLGFLSLDVKQSCRSLISWSCFNVPQFSLKSYNHSLRSWFNKNTALIPVTFSGASSWWARVEAPGHGGSNSGPEAIFQSTAGFDSALGCWQGVRCWFLSLQDPSIWCLCTPWSSIRPSFAPQRILEHYSHPAPGGSEWIFWGQGVPINFLAKRLWKCGFLERTPSLIVKSLLAN